MKCLRCQGIVVRHSKKSVNHYRVGRKDAEQIRGSCRVLVDGTDVTDEVNEFFVGKLGWAVVYSKNHLGQRHICDNAPQYKTWYGRGITHCQNVAQELLTGHVELI